MRGFLAFLDLLCLLVSASVEMSTLQNLLLGLLLDLKKSRDEIDVNLS